MMNNSIDVSKRHIIRKKRDCTVRWYTLHPLKFCQILEILNYSWVAFFLNHPVLPYFLATKIDYKKVKQCNCNWKLQLCDRSLFVILPHCGAEKLYIDSFEDKTWLKP